MKDENGEICGLDSETSNQIRLAYDEFTTNVDELTDMLDGTLEGFSDDLRSLISLTQNIDDSLDTADIFFYILIAISVVIIYSGGNVGGSLLCNQRLGEYIHTNHQRCTTLALLHLFLIAELDICNVVFGIQFSWG